MKKLVATNLSEFISLSIEIACNDGPLIWFRGQSSAAYSLTPSLLREVVPSVDARGNQLKGGGEILCSTSYTVAGMDAERMLNEFKRKARPFIDKLPKNDFEWMFIMQHHGVPTRLLDWTTNALVALYFAVESLNSSEHKSTPDLAASYREEEEVSDEGVAVFAINPVEMNRKSVEVEDVLDIAEDCESWKHYVRPEDTSQGFAVFPICTVAPHISQRIRAQSGAFTLRGLRVEPLEYYEVLRPLIRKIFIPYNSALEIKDHLQYLGITRSFIFPELSGISEEITAKTYKHFQTAVSNR